MRGVYILLFSFLAFTTVKAQDEKYLVSNVVFEQRYLDYDEYYENLGLIGDKIDKAVFQTKYRIGLFKNNKIGYSEWSVMPIYFYRKNVEEYYGSQNTLIGGLAYNEFSSYISYSRLVNMRKKDKRWVPLFGLIQDVEFCWFKNIPVQSNTFESKGWCANLNLSGALYSVHRIKDNVFIKYGVSYNLLYFSIKHIFSNNPILPVKERNINEFSGFTFNKNINISLGIAIKI